MNAQELPIADTPGGLRLEGIWAISRSPCRSLRRHSTCAYLEPG